MPRSRQNLPLRLGLRGARVALRTTRDVADLGLAVLDVAGRALGETDPGAEFASGPAPAPARWAGPPPPPSFADEVADPGARDGAGASVWIAPPVAGYDALRAPDVIALVGGADAATLAAIEQYEQTHRSRKTVLDAVARASRRLG